MKTTTAVLSMLGASVAAAYLLVGRHADPAAPPPSALVASASAANDGRIPPPWELSVQADGSLQALGLTIGQGTLGDAVQRYGVDTQVAVVAAPNEPGHLEAFVDPAQADFVTGKLVISADATPEQLQGWRSRAVKAEFMESTTRRYVLSTNDLIEAMKARVVGLSFIPQAQLDAKTVMARFGEPAERVQSRPQTEHLLYPDKGLDVMIDGDGKELLQYVRPADFETRLRAPLMAAVRAAGMAKAGSAAQP